MISLMRMSEDVGQPDDVYGIDGNDADDADDES